jgi:hypothetical protein
MALTAYLEEEKVNRRCVFLCAPLACDENNLEPSRRACHGMMMLLSARLRQSGTGRAGQLQVLTTAENSKDSQLRVGPGLQR